jgi:hypothetical protein
VRREREREKRERERDRERQGARHREGVGERERERGRERERERERENTQMGRAFSKNLLHNYFINFFESKINLGRSSPVREREREIAYILPHNKSHQHKENKL